MYDFSIIIGRFQPVHTGHLTLFKRAMISAKETIVCLGSSNLPRSTKNPFTLEERKEMIDNISPRKVHYVAINDVLYNDELWATQLRETVYAKIRELSPESDFEYKPKIVLVGADKDHTTYYLNLFKSWDLELVPEHSENLNSTRIRREFFLDGIISEDLVGYKNLKFLESYKREFKYLSTQKEFRFIETYKSQWKNTPYPVIFSTVDACVVQSGHVLLVKRGAYPGKGLYALPGGFTGYTETLKESMLRELEEETKIKVSSTVLEASIREEKVFDNPDRSTRGRTITTAFLIKLNDKFDLPKVVGSDDAESAMWVPTEEIKHNPHLFYEDHWSMIQYFINRL